MFRNTRLKLTAWYLLIIMLISIFFSSAFYSVTTREIERIITRIEYRQIHPGRPMPERISPPNAPSPPSLEELKHSKKQLLLILIGINVGILGAAGLAGYFLAGRTLRPIKEMIDEQNQFISSASHELRTPIATLRAEMEGSLLEKKISDKNARALIKSNLEELGTLQNLTNNLLELAQLHNTKKQKSSEIIKVSEIVRLAERKVKFLAHNKNIDVVTSYDDSTVRGNKMQLVEILTTILDNAIKYSANNKTIRVKTKLENNYVQIIVIDNGMGISKSDLPHIFERFYRSDKSRSQADGFGLGLSIAKKLVELHNGQIDVKSISKKGTTFTIALPHHLPSQESKFS